MDEFKKIHEILVNPYNYTEQWKEETSQKIIGYFCSYTPDEIIHAAGALPFRIFGDEISIIHADAHLQSYCCSLARGALEGALAGKLSFLDGAVFPHTCDTIQRLSDIWRLNAGFPLHFDVVLPAKLNSDSAFQYLVDILRKFKTDLENTLEIEITDDKLREAIQLYNRIREALEEIYQLRSENPGILAGGKIYQALKAAMVMDRTEFLSLVSRLLLELKEINKVTEKNHKKRIVLAGGICNHPDIYSIVENAGGTIVWDDLCTGTRFFMGQIDETIDPIEAIARRYFERTICPTKHFDPTRRGENLAKIVATHKADGVIFLFLKFCDPHAFDYAYLKESLDRSGIPSMLLEVEGQIPAAGQLQTRLEAFVEMV